MLIHWPMMHFVDLSILRFLVVTSAVKLIFATSAVFFLNLSHELQHFRFEVLLICVRHTALHKFGLTDWLVGWLID